VSRLEDHLIEGAPHRLRIPHPRRGVERRSRVDRPGALRTASLAVAGIGAAIAMGTLGSWWAPVILLVATAGAVLVVWRGGATPVGARFVTPVLVVVTALTVASLLGLLGILPSGWIWAALAAYVVAWGEYLVTQTIARSRAAGSAR
jgi:hypothetical protein